MPPSLRARVLLEEQLLIPCHSSGILELHLTGWQKPSARFFWVAAAVYYANPHSLPSTQV